MPNPQIEKLKQALVIHANADLTGEDCNVVIQALTTLSDEAKIGQELTVAVIDLKGTFCLEQDFFQKVTPVAKALQKRFCRIAVVNAPKLTQRMLHDLGLDSLLIPSALSDLPELKSRPAATMPKIEVGFVNPFIDGVINTLSVQCSVEVQAGKLFVKGTRVVATSDIAGIIALNSASFNGSIAICFPKATFLAVMGKLLGETYAEITRDVEDGAGELLNIIFGQAKTVLNEKGYQISKAIPSIVTGQTLQVRHLSESPTLVVPFESQAGAFHIEISVEAPGLTQVS